MTRLEIVTCANYLIYYYIFLEAGIIPPFLFISKVNLFLIIKKRYL